LSDAGLRAPCASWAAVGPPNRARRVAEVIAQARRAIRRARANAVILAFMAAASLLAGAAVAWYAAGFGGRHRDGEAMPAFWLNRPGVR
jgi:hypothetical protein